MRISACRPSNYIAGKVEVGWGSVLIPGHIGAGVVCVGLSLLDSSSYGLVDIRLLL